MIYEPLATLWSDDPSLGPAQIRKSEAIRYWGYVPDLYNPEAAIGLLGAKIGATNKAYSDNCGADCNSTDRMISLFLGQNAGPDAVKGYASNGWDWDYILRNDDQATRNTQIQTTSARAFVETTRTWAGYRTPYPIGWAGQGNMRHQVRRMLNALCYLNWNDLPEDTDMGYIQCLANGGNCSR